MKIAILKKRIKHAGKEYLLGKEYDLTEAMANAWIRAGYAEQVRERQETTSQMIETVVNDLELNVETPVTRKKRGGGI
jgi:hypothetical protein